MTNPTRTAGLALLGALIFSSAAEAQYPGARPSASSPAYSPYLNLTRPGNAANNYYGLVRPQIDFQNQVYGLQQQYGALNQSINNASSDQPMALPATGHAATFMNYANFYPGLGSGRAGGRPGVVTPSAPTPSAPLSGGRR
jgi:hypothetical protein